LSSPKRAGEVGGVPGHGRLLERTRFHHNCELISQLLRNSFGGLTKVMSREKGKMTEKQGFYEFFWPSEDRHSGGSRADSKKTICRRLVWHGNRMWVRRWQSLPTRSTT
jgi:hypothetical protein